MRGSSGAAGVLTVDLGALADNWRYLARRVAPAGCAAVVKADAYGIGIEAAVPALHRAGCRVFFVAHVGEGKRVRAALPREATVLVLNGLESDADPTGEYLPHALSPVIGSAGEARRWTKVVGANSNPPPFAIHVDTGMNRLGFASAQEIGAALGSRASGATLLMSHFVSSEEPDSALNALQIARFEEMRAVLPGVPASLANSSALFLPQRPFYDLVRPGYALYGGNPTAGKPNPMKAVVKLEVVIQQTRWVEAGKSVGYNAQWIAPRRARLATLLAGYADGLPRTAGATDDSAGADVMIAGRRCALVGRMSMDLCVADVTELTEAEARPGVYAEILGETIGVDELGSRSRTIGYHILTSLGSRYQRIYLGA
jgi:alanine racemase